MVLCVASCKLCNTMKITLCTQTVQVYVALCATRCLVLQSGTADWSVSSEHIQVWRRRGVAVVATHLCMYKQRQTTTQDICKLIVTCLQHLGDVRNPIKHLYAALLDLVAEVC